MLLACYDPGARGLEPVGVADHSTSAVKSWGNLPTLENGTVGNKAPAYFRGPVVAAHSEIHGFLFLQTFQMTVNRSPCDDSIQ